MAKTATVAKKAQKLIADSTGAGEAAFLLMHADLERFEKNRELVLGSEDPEAVHDMRVAIRRLRAALKTFGAFLPRALLDLDSELSWIFKKLGDLRDLDIQIAKLAAWHSQEGLDTVQLRPLVGKMEEERKRARGSLLKALHDKRFHELETQLRRLISHGPTVKKGLTLVPVLAVAPDLVRKRFRKTAKAAKGLHQGSPSTDFHRVRKQAKKLRYSLEFFRELYDKPAEEMIGKLKDVQDMLGARQDDIVARDHLEELAAKNGLSADAKDIANQIGCVYRSEARSLEKDFPALSKKAFGQPWRVLYKEMQAKRRDLWRG